MKPLGGGGFSIISQKERTGEIRADEWSSGVVGPVMHNDATIYQSPGTP